MKTRIFVAGLSVALVVSGCADREAAARKAKQDVEAKARADAARKEMDALPKAFKSPPFFKLNEPEKKPEAVPAPKKSNP